MSEKTSTYQSKMKVIISGGGTGGHIFPAVAIANELKARYAHAEILFVGALGRMEMEKVPQAGYKIIGLNIAGIQRSMSIGNMIKNLKFPFKLYSSLIEAKKIVKDFKPDFAIGVGGYASGPLLWAASGAKIPCLIQEQNSYAGLTNKWLSKRVQKICVAYDKMDRYFDSSKIIETGNPVRKDIIGSQYLRLPALVNFKLSSEKKTILVIGGSLGAKTINDAIANGLEKIHQAGYQLIWQTGKTYYSKASELTQQKGNGWGEVKAHEFIKEMHLAYGCADVVISRAGALSISELCILGKPCVLVPSPNVSEDHQTKNAMNLVDKNAALIVKDIDAASHLVDTVLNLLKNNHLQKMLSENILKLGKPKATESIVDEIEKILQIES